MIKLILFTEMEKATTGALVLSSNKTRLAHLPAETGEPKVAQALLAYFVMIASFNKT